MSPFALIPKVCIFWHTSISISGVKMNLIRSK
jgi:hypothetical protein